MGRVVIQDPAGNQMAEFMLDPEVSTLSIDDVKEAVADGLGVPQRFQTLALGSQEITHDTELALGTNLARDDPLEVLTLTINVDEAHRSMTTGSHCEVIRTLNDFCDLGSKGYPRIAVAVAAQLEHTSEDLRSPAVDAIGSIAQNGDQQAIRAVTALGKIAQSGDEQATIAVSAGRVDRAADVRKAAVDALGKIAQMGDQQAITAVSARLKDVDVEKAAVRALGDIVQQGNEQTSAAVFASLENSITDMMKAAVGRQGDQLAIAAVSARLNQRNLDVREAAMDVLGSILQEGDQQAITAADALGKIAQRAGLHTLAAVPAPLEVGAAVGTDSAASELDPSLPSLEAGLVRASHAEDTEDCFAVTVFALTAEAKAVTDLQPSSRLLDLRGLVGEAFRVPPGQVQLILGTRLFTTAELRSTLRALGVCEGSELTFIRQPFFNMVAGMRVKLCFGGTEAVNGTYVCCPTRDLHGNGPLMLRQEGTGPIHWIAWWEEGAWPAGWYVEDEDYQGSYYPPSENHSQVPLSLWEVYTMLDSKPGAPPVPGIRLL